jgi:glutathione synthase
VLLRQDPPFDLAYTSTHFLERIHPKTLVVNNPASVRNAPEKIFVMDFPDLMPPTLISRDLDEINSFRAEHGAVVTKPLHGHGGAAVFRILPQDMNFGSLYDMFSVMFREPWVIQRFLPEVKHGDKRIILVDGDSPAPSTACRPPTTCAPTWFAAAQPKRPTSRPASGKSARGSHRPCASAGCCSSAST